MDVDDLESRFEAALRGDDPIEALIRIVGDLREQGVGQRDIYLLFQERMSRLREAGREADEDRVMDVMDLIVGFCSPSACLFPDEPYDPNLGV